MKVFYYGINKKKRPYEIRRLAWIKFRKSELPMFRKICKLLPPYWGIPLSHNIVGNGDEMDAMIKVKDKEEYLEFLDHYKTAKLEARQNSRKKDSRM